MSSASELAAKVEEMASDLDDEVEDAVDDGADDMATQSRVELHRNDSVVHGALLGSLDVESNPSGVPARTIARRIETDMPYSAFVEYGTGTFNTASDSIKRFKSPDPMPPFGPIYQWVIRKGLTIDDPSVIQRGANHIENQRNLARAIQQSIGMKGNRPHPFMRPAYRKHRDSTVGRVADALDDTVGW